MEAFMVYPGAELADRWSEHWARVRARLGHLLWWQLQLQLQLLEPNRARSSDYLGRQASPDPSIPAGRCSAVEAKNAPVVAQRTIDQITGTFPTNAMITQ